MKKWFGILFSTVVLLALVGCRGGDDPTQNASTTSATTLTSLTSAGSVDMTNTTKAEVSEVQKNAAEDYIPVDLFSMSQRKNMKVYVNRRDLIDYINRHSSVGYFERDTFVNEVEPLFPIEFSDANPFDANNRAIARLQNGDESGYYAVLIDENGSIVIGAQGDIDFLYPAGPNYLGIKYDLNQAAFATLYDKEGNILSQSEEMQGIPSYADGRIFTTEGEAYDGTTLVRVEPRQIPELEQFAWRQSLGNGYYEVADFAQYKSDVEGIDLTTPEASAALDAHSGIFVKALYKDGELLTGYDYYTIIPVVPYQADTFYFVDRNGAKIVNVKTGTAYSAFDLRNQGDIDRCYLYPDLCIMDSGIGKMFITSENMLYTSWVLTQGENLFWNYVKYDQPLYYSIPQIILRDTSVMDKINKDILKEFLSSLKASVERTDVILRRESVYGIMTVASDRLIVEKRIDNYVVYPDSFEEKVSTRFYNLKTGERIAFRDFFEDYDAAKERMLALVDEAFRAEFPERYGNVVNLEETYQPDKWEQILGYGPEGFTLYFDAQDMSLDRDWDYYVKLRADDLMDYLKPEYRALWGYE